MTFEFGPKSADELNATALKLIGLIYEAAVDPDRWNDFLRVYGELYPGASQWLWLEDRDRADVRVLTNDACDTSFLPAYQAHYAATNPWTDTMLKHPEGHFHLADSLAPRDALEASEFYNDWMRPQDLDNGFGASVLKFGRHFMFYSLLHTKRAKTGERDLELLRLLVPHMQRSARLYGHFLGLQEKIDSTTAALDRLAIGALLCDRTGRVLVMNKAAERMIMLGDGLNLIAGHLKPAHKTESDTMAKLIAGATQMDEGGLESCGGALTISRPSGRRSFGVIVAPYQGNPPPSLCVRLAPATRVAIFIADPDARNEPPQQVIARLFGLTVAEAHLASKVAQGRPLPEISEELGITRETARSRLKTIFAKTDTHSQASLAKLILSGPAGLLLGAGPETAEPL